VKAPADAMPNSLTQPGSIYAPGAMSLDDEIQQAKEEINKQKDAIAGLTAEDQAMPDARQQLDSMLENFAFLVKLRSYAT
jgi:hypothetical protein